MPRIAWRRTWPSWQSSTAGRRITIRERPRASRLVRRAAPNEPDGRVASLVFRTRRAISGGGDLPGSGMPQSPCRLCVKWRMPYAAGWHRCGLPAVAGGDGAAARFAPGRGCCQYGVVEAGGAARIVIVPPSAGRAAAAGNGALIAVVDVQGHQVGDMWAVDAADHGRWLSPGHPRDRCERLFPALGEEFRDQHGEPILRLVPRTSPGGHDMLFPGLRPGDVCQPRAARAPELPG